MYVLGYRGYGHDTGVALIKDGKILYAMEEERFNREKRTSVFPSLSLDYCLKKQNLKLNDIEAIVIPMDTWFAVRYRLGKAMSAFPRSYVCFVSISKLIKRHFIDLYRLKNFFGKGVEEKLYFVRHHTAHASSAFLVSPFEEAAIFSIDGSGESESILLAKGEGSMVTRLWNDSFWHSMGNVYTAVSNYLGFGGTSPEGKVMGLSSYGKLTYYDFFKKIIKLEPEGKVKLDLSYFTFHLGRRNITYYIRRMTNQPEYARLTGKFARALGPCRIEDGPLDQRHMDIAASLQKRLEDVGLHVARHLYEITKCQNLCMAGGVALNSVMNGRILAETPFKDIFIQPAAHDGGCILGAALYYYHTVLGKDRTEVMDNAYLGREFSDSEIEDALKGSGLKYQRDNEITKTAAGLLADGNIIGWFQGKEEYGPRALGNRSILADPRRKDMKDILNDRVKHREWFRPFAPAVLEEASDEYFDSSYPSPFMLLVYNVRPEKKEVIPAVTHVDGTARVQTVNRKQSPKFYELISEFGKVTGVPVILNTSFNVRGEPIVGSPEDAIKCFKSTHMDYLVMGDFLVSKK